MNIRDLQTTIKARNHRPESPERAFFKLMEEVGQLAESLRANAHYKPGVSVGQVTIDEELADVLFALFTVANLYNVDIEQALTFKEQLQQLRVNGKIAPVPTLSTAEETPTSAQELHAYDTIEDKPTPPEEPMPATAIDLKTIAQRFINELWNQRKLDVADEIFAENCITNQLRSGSEPVTAPRTPAAVKKQVGDWVSAFPDFRYNVRQMMSDGDKIVTLCVATGTHQGTWLGLPATGKAISIETMITHRIADGKIVEDWVLADFLGLFQQLGLVAPLQELLAARKS